MTEHYQSPLASRYASDEMSSLFSAQKKYSTWRIIWLALAKAQKDLGLCITQEQINEMEAHLEDIDFKRVEKYEKMLRHDVMAHIHTFGESCPLARPIIHLGATSCLVSDNADVLILKEALELLLKKLFVLIEKLSEKAEFYKNTPCLGYTHFQAAQPTTLGKRISLWIQDILLDISDLDYRLKNLKLLGIKGATGTQASFLDLFNGDHGKVKKLESLICKSLGFEKVFSVSAQTYSRKQDMHILDLLSGIAVTSHKMATDFRLLAHLKELEEPFGKDQIGSSAMPYKRNPMQSERVCSLSRYVISLGENPKYTAATQWLERTLDDSANRRLCIPEAFLAIDAIINISIYLADGMVAYPKVMEKRLKEELPFIATESVLMASVKKGANRQNIHERIRKHSVEVAKRLKELGLDNDLIERIAKDPEIPLSMDELEEIFNINSFIGRAPQQVEEFLKNEVEDFFLKHEGTNMETLSPILIKN